MTASGADIRRNEGTAAATARDANTPTDGGLLILRLVVGLLFAGHGAQKLFGWFGGWGLAAWQESLGSLGYEPARWFALGHGVAELAGGLLLALGLFTPLGAAALIGVGINAVVTKVPNGLWIQNGGYEYEVVLVAIGIAFALAGAGSLSLDRRLPWARGGAISAVTALVVGVGLGVAAYVLRGG